MNLKTSAICIMLVGLTLGLEGMKKASAPKLTPAQEGQLVQLKKAIGSNNVKHTLDTLNKISVPLPSDILFSLSGDTQADIEIIDLIIENMDLGGATNAARRQVFLNFQNPNIKNITLVHRAVEQGWIMVLHKLIILGASTNTQATDGKTPLARAIERYCLLCRGKNLSTTEQAEQIIKLLQQTILISMQDYTRDVQAQIVKVFKFEASDKSNKPLLPDFLTMEAFKLQDRNFAQKPVLPAISPTQGQPQPQNGINHTGNGQHPTAALQPQPFQYWLKAGSSAPNQSVTPKEPVASSSNTNTPVGSVVRGPLAPNNPISTPTNAHQAQGQQPDTVQEIRILNGLKAAVGSRLVDDVKGILERNPYIALPENIFTLQVNNPDSDDPETTIVRLLINHIVQNDRPLEPYIKYVVENQHVGILDLLLKRKTIVTVDVLQAAVQSLIRNAQLNKFQANAIQILQKLTAARTLSVNERETIQTVLAAHFYWGGDNGQPGKHQLPDVCVPMVTATTYNLIGQNPAAQPAIAGTHQQPQTPAPRPIMPHDNQQNNSAASMLTRQNKYILVFGACALVVFAAYAWLYQDEMEDDKPPHDESAVLPEEMK